MARARGFRGQVAFGRRSLCVLLAVLLMLAAVPPLPARAVVEPPVSLPTISAGYQHAMTIASSNGSLRAWGWNAADQLAVAHTNEVLSIAVPVTVPDLTNVIAVAGGKQHSLALTSDGTVWAWGDNIYGQLGNGTATENPITTPAQVKVMVLGQPQPLSGIVAIAAGQSHSLALKNDGTVWAWGSDDKCQIGDGWFGGPGHDQLKAVKVNNLANVVAISVGSDGLFSLALTSDGTVWAWGDNAFGQIGDNTQYKRPNPVQVLTGVKAIAAGYAHSLALKTDGSVWAWGVNSEGAFGNGNETSSMTPVQVAGLTGITAISAGNAFSLFLDSDRHVRAAGLNSDGQLGDGGGTLARSTPEYVHTAANEHSLSDVVAISAGGLFGLALKSDGTVVAWGSNTAKELGIDSPAVGQRAYPVQISLNTTVLWPSAAAIPTPTQVAGTLTDGFVTMAAGNTAVSADNTWTINVTAGTLKGAVNADLTADLTVSGLPSGLTWSAKNDGANNVVITVAGTASSAVNTQAAVSVTVKGSAVIDAGATASAAITVTVQPAPASPIVTSVANAWSDKWGAQGATVTISGSKFTGATAVSFGGTAAAGFTVVSDTQITATAPAGTGAVNVTVTTATGTSLASSGSEFTYLTGSELVRIWNTGGGNLSPAYDPQVSSYGTTSRIAGIGELGYALADPAATVQFQINDDIIPGSNGSVVGGFQIGSVSIPDLNKGANTILVTVSLGVTEKTYTVIVKYPPNTFSPDGDGDVATGAPITIDTTGMSGSQECWYTIIPGEPSPTPPPTRSAPSIQYVGTPFTITTPGTYTIVAAIYDPSGSLWSDPLEAVFTVVAPPPSITSASLPDATVGEAYSFTVTATGGTAPLTWTGGDLAEGLKFDETTATISGTPTEAGRVYPVFTVTDDISDETRLDIWETSLLVNPPHSHDEVSAPPLPTASVLDSAANTTGIASISVNTLTGTANVPVTAAALIDAFEQSSPDAAGMTAIEVAIPKIQGVTTYEPVLPASFLASGEASQAVAIRTDLATVTVPGDMLAATDATGVQNASITIAAGDKASLPATVQAQIGDRPLIQLGLKLDGQPRTWSNADATVTVSIPYTPTAAELADPEHITVWYIDGAGKPVAVPSGRYDAAIGLVTFNVTHFSDYAVVFVEKTFADLGDFAWAKRQVEVLAAKGIIGGTSADTFSPAAAITRADYLVLLVKTLGLSAGFDSNFADVNPGDYYYDAVGIARELGITSGVGGNLFNPKARISRQDMMVLTARSLEHLGTLKIAATASVLDRFADRADIAPYAVESLAMLVGDGLIQGAGGVISPLAPTTRAEAAVFMYRIYNR